jgi:dTMP kinase
LKRRGAFITLEGIDGSGKSTQLRLLAQYMRKRGHGVCLTREPGGTKVGEKVRDLLLASGTGRLSHLAELVLMYAARAQHLEEVVRPALARGEIAVSDRYNDASFAYQGYGRKLGVETVRAFDRVVCGATQPGLTLVLDLDPRVALARAHGRETRRNSRHDRFELQGLAFHRRVRQGYLEIARRDPKRVKVVKADRPIAEVHAEIRRIVDKFLAQHRQARGTRDLAFGARKKPA